MKSLFLPIALLVGIHSFSSEAFLAKSETSFADKFKVEEAVHRIQLAQFSDYVPVKYVELMRQIGGVSPISKNGISTYYSAAINSEDEASKLLPKYISFGFEDARHVVEYQDKIYSLKQYNVLKSGGDLPKNDKIPVIRIWK